MFTADILKPATLSLNKRVFQFLPYDRNQYSNLLEGKIR